MMILREKSVFNSVILEVELQDDLSYRLSYGTLVEYLPGKKRIRNRTLPYEFKSVEKLRYDFEQDVKAAGGTLGEDS
jgi:hypothetical protein